MIENILIFVRNCVMAVLTAWAGIYIAETARSAPVEPLPVAASGTPTPTRTVDAGPGRSCQPGRSTETPGANASAEPDLTTPTAQPSVMTIR